MPFNPLPFDGHMHTLDLFWKKLNGGFFHPVYRHFLISPEEPSEKLFTTLLLSKIPRKKLLTKDNLLQNRLNPPLNVELRKQKEGPWVNIDPVRGKWRGTMTEIAPKAPGFKVLLQKKICFVNYLKHFAFTWDGALCDLCEVSNTKSNFPFTW